MKVKIQDNERGKWDKVVDKSDEGWGGEGGDSRGKKGNKSEKCADNILMKTAIDVNRGREKGGRGGREIKGERCVVLIKVKVREGKGK